MALLKVQVVLMLLSSAWMLASNPDKDDAANQMWNNLIMKVDDALIKYGPPEFIEFWNSLTDDEFETITTVMDEVKQSWSSAAEAIVRVYGDGFWAGRYTIIRTEFHRRIDILPLQWRKIMAEIVDSILTFNEMRFLRAFLAFKELPANGRKRIYEEFPWMRKMMHLYGWGEFFPELLPMFLRKMFPWTRSAERAIDIEFSEPTWHHVADEVSRTNKGLAERITELHRNLCSKFPRIEDFMSGKAVMYELINNMMMSSKMRWIRTLTSFAFLADFEREELIEVFPWIKDLWELFGKEINKHSILLRLHNRDYLRTHLFWYVERRRYGICGR